MFGVRWMFVLTLLLSSTALAQETATAAPSAPNPEAAEHFERGVQLFKEQAFRAAVVEFQRAYDLAPDYRLHYNLGRAKQQLQDYLGAAQNYEAYLIQGGSDIAIERRTQIEETLSSLTGRVARIDIKVSRAGADVFIDDVKVGVSPLGAMVRTNVGRHRISARSADGALGSEIVDVAGGDLAEVNIKVSEAPVASAPQLEREETSQSWSWKRKLALTSLVAGTAVLAGSVATGVLSLRDQNRLDSQVGELGIDQSSVAAQRDKVDTLSLTTDVLLGAGAALVVTGTVLWLVGRERTPAQSPSARANLKLNVGIGSLALGGRF